MEPSINSLHDPNVTDIMDNIFSDVPLVATYLKILLLLVIIPVTIIPAVVIIHIIRKTEELHTKYCLFLVNLLISDILNGIRYCFAIFIMILYLLDIRLYFTYISDIVFVIITIPHVTNRYCFVLLAVDRVVGVAFPYHYRNIMKLKVVYSLIVSVWIIAAVLLFSTTLLGSPYIVYPFGSYFPPPGVVNVIILYLLPEAVSAISIVGANVYLHRSIVQSKKKLENNLKLSGRDEHKITKLQRLIHNLQLQLESSLPLFILGGIDCLFIVLRITVSAIIKAIYPFEYYPVIAIILLELLVFPLVYCQIISHSVTYGIYNKQVKKKICCYYQRFKRLFPLCPSKVITLHPQ